MCPELHSNFVKRNTYEARISELRGTDSSYQNKDGKALPERPRERDSKDSERLSIVTDDDEEEEEEEEAIFETATTTPLGNEHTHQAKRPHLVSEAVAKIPPRRQSLQPSPYKAEGRDVHASGQMQHQQLRMRYNVAEQLVETPLYLEAPVLQEYMPPPLSPRRPLSPAHPKETTQATRDPSLHSAISDESNQLESDRQDNGEHTSWLNTINESSGSSSSSVHSRRSSIGLRRKHIRPASGQTEADFDATLDAAFEAAYDDGFELDDEEDDEQLIHAPEYQFGESEPSSLMRRNIELAKENIHEAEREAAISAAKDRERQRLQSNMAKRDSIDIEYGDDEADEEERMLEEMTRDYILDDSEYDVQTKSALPRQSDSSGFSGRTWGSSVGSNPTSAGTSLSTVAEASVLPSMATKLMDNAIPPPLNPPPSGALPPPPVSAIPNISQHSNGIVARPPILPPRNSSPGVRDRRLSKAKQLKIETNTKLSATPVFKAPKAQPPSFPPPAVPLQPAPEPPKSAFIVESPQTLPDIAFKPPLSATLAPSRKESSPLPGSDSTELASSTASALTKVTSADSDTSLPSMPGSPARFATKAATGLRKNFSSSSLRNKNLTVTVPDSMESSTASLSSMSSTPKQRKVPSPAIPVLPTPLETNFITKGQPMIYLFEIDIHSPNSPGSPNPLASNAPLPLEPCPESTLLRPFWLLRSVYQTIAHPRGGYISNRLFVPRDIWRVKNLKLKNVEEKISSCDLLTAALLKLGKVDTLDANAVLNEMQSFETIMEQVQANLAKKLGSEVGVQGAAQTFKGLNAGEEVAANSDILTSKTINANSKSYLSSWRKLRPRNTSGQGFPSASMISLSKDSSKDAPTMKSLPMTTNQNPRFPKRDVSQVQCLGPNPSYMGALARLCDAAQILGKLWKCIPSL